MIKYTFLGTSSSSSLSRCTTSFQHSKRRWPSSTNCSGGTNVQTHAKNKHKTYAQNKHKTYAQNKHKTYAQNKHKTQAQKKHITYAQNKDQNTYPD